jgi:hypothetical protein
MNLLPKVKHMEVRAGFLAKKVICPDVDGMDRRLAAALEKLPCDAAGTKLEIHVSGHGGEGYELIIDEAYIEISAESSAGAFYAIQTLRQLLREEQVPCLQIRDWPDFAYRGFYHDVTRGKIPKVETIKKLVDNMAYYKMNSLQLYVEHVFEFQETKALWKSAGYLTKAEMQEIDAYCRENFIDFVPSLSTFGHLHDLLEQEQYKHLRVFQGEERLPNFWDARMHHHTIDPLNPESFEVIKSLIDQYAPCFSSEYFNICCDETFDLKCYGEKGYDVGRLYVDFVKKIVDYVQKKGKKVMMWADIVSEHPETIAELPDDIWFLNWHYGDDVEGIREKVEKFSMSGKAQIVCPGTSSWNRFCEKTDQAEMNITQMIGNGYRCGALGVLNTNWGDWGNIGSLELGMYSMVLGAGKSWAADTEPDKAFYGMVNSLLYGAEDGVRALKAVSALQDRIKWTQVCKNYFLHRYNNGEGMEFFSGDEVQAIQREYLKISGELSGESWGNDEYRRELLLAAEGVCVMAELSAKLAGYGLERVSNTEEWLCKYREKWLEKNKASELYRIEELFLYYEQKACRAV